MQLEQISRSRYGDAKKNAGARTAIVIVTESAGGHLDIPCDASVMSVPETIWAIFQRLSGPRPIFYGMPVIFRHSL